LKGAPALAYWHHPFLGEEKEGGHGV